jgi:hypothetical protein
VRYALGYRQLGEGYFDLRTLYYFRERLSRYMQETGRNLLDEAFEQVTDEQLAALGRNHSAGGQTSISGWNTACARLV